MSSGIEKKGGGGRMGFVKEKHRKEAVEKLKAKITADWKPEQFKTVTNETVKYVSSEGLDFFRGLQLSSNQVTQAQIEILNDQIERMERKARRSLKESEDKMKEAIHKLALLGALIYKRKEMEKLKSKERR